MLSKLIVESLSESVDGKNNTFDIFLRRFNDHFYNLRSNDMNELKHNQDINKQKGTLFEQLCKEIILENGFKRLRKYHIHYVWLFSELTKEQREFLRFKSRGKLTKQDMGIDIVALTADNRWIAIQCKYISEPRKRFVPGRGRIPWQVPHAKLSTFYSLCNTTGPRGGEWYKQVVITSAETVKHQGELRKCDISICNGSFRNFKRELWENMVDVRGHMLGTAPRGPVQDSGPHISDENFETKKGSDKVSKNDNIDEAANDNNKENMPPPENKKRIVKGKKAKELVARNAFLDNLVNKSKQEEEDKNS